MNSPITPERRVRPLPQGVLLFAALWGCLCSLSADRSALATPKAPKDGTVLPIAASIRPIGAWAERLGGDGVRVTTIVPASVAPELFEISVAARRQLEAANLVLLVGHAGFEYELQIRETLTDDERKSAVLMFSEVEPDAASDPHLWLSVDLIEKFLPRLANRIIELRPELREVVVRNLEAEQQRLRVFRAGAAERLRAARVTHFLVFHPTWGRFAEEFGLEQLSVESETHEAGPGRLAQVLKKARAIGLRQVFVQPQFSTVAAQSIARELGGTIIEVDPLAADSIAAMEAFVQHLTEPAAAAAKNPDQE